MHEFLYRPLDELGLSRRFAQQCAGMGFENLAEILSCPPAELLARRGFSYEWLRELTGILDERQLLHLLQTIPGKSYD